jgi:hypothetical protein
MVTPRDESRRDVLAARGRHHSTTTTPPLHRRTRALPTITVFTRGKDPEVTYSSRACQSPDPPSYIIHKIRTINLTDLLRDWPISW